MTRFEPSGGGDSLASFTAELEEMKANAEEMTERLRTATATVRAPDGAVSVTMGASGVLQEIAFGTKAYNKTPEVLSALVMRLVAEAQQEVSTEVSDAFSGLVGESSSAMAILREFLPGQDGDGDGDGDGGEDARSAPAASSQGRPPRSAPDEDDENEDERPW